MLEINISKDNIIVARVYAGLEEGAPTYWYENLKYKDTYCKKITALEFAEICAKNKQAHYRSEQCIGLNDLCYEQEFITPREYTQQDWKKQLDC